MIQSGSVDLIVAYYYTHKSAGTNSTDAANRKAFDRWKLVPRVLNDAALRNVEVSASEILTIM
jgi:lactate 2-monooxygenase